MRLVIPSWNYSDFLAVTLPAWKELVGAQTITVVTGLEDADTFAVCERHGVHCFATDAWKRDAAVLNKAAALDEAFGFSPSEHVIHAVDGDVCLSVDADVYPFGSLPPEDSIQRDVIYGCLRYDCPNPEYFNRFRNGRIPKQRWNLMRTWGGRAKKSQHRDCCQVLCGYFQMFRYSADRTFGSYPAANEYDVQFGLKFPRSENVKSIYVAHLGENHINWAGRVADKWEPAA